MLQTCIPAAVIVVNTRSLHQVHRLIDAARGPQHQDSRPTLERAADYLTPCLVWWVVDSCVMLVGVGRRGVGSAN